MKKLLCPILLLLLSAGCKEKYTPPHTSPVTGYLVVEGFINNGPEPTSIALTRTTKLVDTASIIYEHNAQVTVEGNNGDNYSLYESGNGVYTIASLPLNTNEEYRLHIYTADGREYLSDFSTVKTTPPVDSLSWQRDGEGVHIFVNTHDPQNSTKYYQWQYDETWEFHSAYYSSLIYTFDPLTNQISGVGYRLPSHTEDTSIYKCWLSPHSTNILIGSSEKLTTDRIYLPLIYIAEGEQRLSVLYSVLMKQHAVSKGNYEFLQKMKKNTEQLGSIFDAQPSELKGNMHCVSNPAEPVIGYMEVSQLQTKRLFIKNSELPGWGYRQACEQTDIVNNPDSIRTYGLGLIPTSASKSDAFSIIRFYASEPICVDCTLRGSNIRPDFWP